jgi:hypothetical protein
MPILNYTTEVSAEQTVGEITALLIRKAALQDDGRTLFQIFIESNQKRLGAGGGR